MASETATLKFARDANNEIIDNVWVSDPFDACPDDATIDSQTGETIPGFETEWTLDTNVDPPTLTMRTPLGDVIYGPPADWSPQCGSVWSLVSSPQAGCASPCACLGPVCTPETLSGLCEFVCDPLPSAFELSATNTVDIWAAQSPTAPSQDDIDFYKSVLGQINVGNTNVGEYKANGYDDWEPSQTPGFETRRAVRVRITAACQATQIMWQLFVDIGTETQMAGGGGGSPSGSFSTLEGSVPTTDQECPIPPLIFPFHQTSIGDGIGGAGGPRNCTTHPTLEGCGEDMGTAFTIGS